ncbi:putative membrane protein, partial [Chlamydia psittaci 02DC22]
IKNFY